MQRIPSQPGNASHADRANRRSAIAARVASGLGRIVAAAVVAAAILLGTAPAAQAHATLLFATPAVEGAVPASPEQLQLVFDQAVLPAESALEVRGPDGGQVRLGRAASGQDRRTVTAPVQEKLAAGQYVVDWTVTAADADTMTGESGSQWGPARD